MKGKMTMTKEVKKVFGIDLGTTYSCISYIDENGKAVIIKNAENELITPSVVFFDDGGDNIIVGNIAKESAKMYPEDVASFVKRSMGDEHFLFFHGDKQYSAEEISSFVLRKLVNDAQNHLGEEIEDVVITCPAYFGINEREATQKAAEIAGLNALQIINEPTAAAVTYGLNENKDQTILVYDLGGGTFDVTIIQTSENKTESIVTGGDQTLGGKDWDDAIINYLVEQYHEETGKYEDILADPETFQDLLDHAEKAKKTLSLRNTAPIAFLHGTDRIRVKLTKEKFEEITSHLVERTISLTKSMLEEAKKKGVEEFDEIILVGGSTRMPQITEAIEAAFNKKPELYDPDEAVAKGAALYGHQKIVQQEVLKKYSELTGNKDEDFTLHGTTEEMDQDVLDEATNQVADEFKMTLGSVQNSVKQEIINVTSKSFGVIAFNKDDEEVVFNLILKNSSVPIEVTQQFSTREDNQLDVGIQIRESEVSDIQLEIDHSIEIGTATLEMPTGLPKGSPLEVTFTLNDEGRLEVIAKELNEDLQIFTTVETSSVISGEALEEAKERSRAIVVS